MAEDTGITPKHVWDKIGDERVSMLLTYDGSKIEARPMAPKIDTERHEIRYLTGHPSEKTQEIADDSDVTVVFCNPSRGLYVTVHGTARVTRDKAVIDATWGPMGKAYFEGKDDPHLAVLVVTPTKAHVWEEHNTVTQAWEAVTSIFSSDKRPDMGTAGTVRM